MENKIFFQNLTKIFCSNLSRRDFFKLLGISFLFYPSKLQSQSLEKNSKKLNPREKKEIKTDYDLVVVKGNNISEITKKAIDTLGGIHRFVHKNDVVVIKPNIGWDRTPEQAANTNSVVIETLVKMCKDAGARIVKVFDNTCNDPRRAYINSGIYDVVKKAGGIIYYVNDWNFYPAQFSIEG